MKKIRQLILFTFVLLLFMTSIATSAWTDKQTKDSY